MDSKSIENLVSDKDLNEIIKLISEDAKYKKLSKKQGALLDKMKVIVDKFNSKAQEYVKKFAQKKDVDFFKKRLAKYYGYMKYSTESAYFSA